MQSSSEASPLQLLLSEPNRPSTGHYDCRLLSHAQRHEGLLLRFKLSLGRKKSKQVKSQSIFVFNPVNLTIPLSPSQF